MKLPITQLGVLLLSANPIFAQHSAADFVGTWELTSIEDRTEAGEWIRASLPNLGGEPVGIIIYDDKGNMAVQITGNRRRESPSSNGAIVNGYVAYYARYEVNAEEGTVTHHRRNHVNPAYGNLSVVRYFRFEDDVLTLTIAPGRQRRLNWVRVR